MATWITSLLANSLRIIVAMVVTSDGAEPHRLIGMMIYVPLLSLQLSPGGRRDKPGYPRRTCLVVSAVDGAGSVAYRQCTTESRALP